MLKAQTYSRRLTRVVSIGDIPLGGSYPIRVQSMTTTDTLDTAATVAQSIRMIEAGSEYVRITAPSLKEAENLRLIKDELRRQGYNTPLIADIHFTPNAAELAARIVEKVRINPGNYIDKKKFELKEYSDAEYEAELDRIRQRFSPLVKICKEYGTAMRIGTNHGSLSDRIMNRYGDTPLGMVESALEFLRICEDLDYHQIVLSMKSSNPVVMIEAYRLLVQRIDEAGMNYPLHLGVTEAGEGDEGRIKSAIGIGALLEEGIGDTIRVSLTEAPEAEIPVAKALVKRYESLPPASAGGNIPAAVSVPPVPTASAGGNTPTNHTRRKTFEVVNLGSHNVPRVVADLSRADNRFFEDISSLSALDYRYNPITDKWNFGDQASDYIYFGSRQPEYCLPNGLKTIYDSAFWQQLEDKEHSFPLFSITDYLSLQGTVLVPSVPLVPTISSTQSPALNFVEASVEDLDEKIIASLARDKTCVLFLKTAAPLALSTLRAAFRELKKSGFENPVVLKFEYQGLDKESFLLYSSTDAGALLADGLGDGLLISYHPNSQIPEFPNSQIPRLINHTAFYILQASRTRISRTEYISCPSCGRTLFDLQETTGIIRQATDHLKGVKIAIMGCIVNGPGEMADADYGYVGTGPHKITLYRGREVVKRNVETRHALDELIGLIKEDGLWVEKEQVN